MKKNKKLSVETPNVGPVSITVVDPIEKRMEAILSITKSIENLTKLLITSPVVANVSNCVISGSDVGISIGTNPVESYD